ncbi:GH11592, partial [Drosophila grimshawi]
CIQSTGAAIKCFVCDSSDNPSCADLGTNSSIVPEECTLDKMKSLDTWLFDLNKFSYFDNGGNKNPLMNCQKVVAKDPDTRKLVTARFCQLDTGDSNACEILRSKLKITSDSGSQRGQQRRRERDQQQQQRRKGYGQDAEEESPEEQFFCDICKMDRCNGAAAVTLTSWMGVIGVLLLLLPRPFYC